MLWSHVRLAPRGRLARPRRLCENLDRLAEILRACVHEGASVGFVLPFDMDEAQRLLARQGGARRMRREAGVVLVATLGGTIVGTAQLDLDTMPSKRHHAEVSKVLVDPDFRRARRRARADGGDRTARAAAGRWLLTLDTAGDAAEALYRSLGYAARRRDPVLRPQRVRGPLRRDPDHVQGPAGRRARRSLTGRA